MARDLKNALLYRVSYYRRRINLEVFHALSDGSGGVVFLQTLVYNYLQLRHPDELAGTPRQPGASADDMGQDSYHKFYARRAAAPLRDPAASKPVCRLPGRRLPLDQTQFLKGTFLSKRCWPARAPWMFR